MIPMKQTPLSQLAVVSAGQGAPKDNEFSESGTPFVRAGSLEALLSGKNESELELVSTDTANLRKLKTYPKGTILFAKSGMSATKDRVYVLQSPAHVVSHLATLIPKDGAHGDYLRLALKRFPPSSLIKDPAYPAIGLGEIENFEIPVPEDFDDQIRIARLLGKVEGLIAQRKKHLQQLDDLLKSVFLEIFGDPVRNERGWATEPLGGIASIERGRFSPRPRNDPKFFGGIYPFIQTGDITRSGGRLKQYTQTLNDLGTKVSKEFKVGTIVIAIVGATIGETAILEIPTYAPDSVIGITPTAKDLEDAIFIEYVLRFWKPVLRANAPEAARANINIETLRPLKIVMPPDRATFSKAVVKVEVLKSAYQRTLTDLESLYGALSQQAFKGELDLSRVLLPEVPEPMNEEIEGGDSPQPEEAALLLHEADLLLSAINDREQLEPLLSYWLEAHCEFLGDKTLSVDEFVRALVARAEEMFPDREFELGADGYDLIKAWVFDALREGRLEQVYPNRADDIRVAVRKPRAVAEG